MLSSGLRRLFADLTSRTTFRPILLLWFRTILLLQGRHFDASCSSGTIIRLLLPDRPTLSCLIIGGALLCVGGGGGYPGVVIRGGVLVIRGVLGYPGGVHEIHKNQ